MVLVQSCEARGKVISSARESRSPKSVTSGVVPNGKPGLYRCPPDDLDPGCFPFGDGDPPKIDSIELGKSDSVGRCSFSVCVSNDPSQKNSESGIAFGDSVRSKIDLIEFGGSDS